MNKSELIREVAKRSNVPIDEARKIVEATLEVIAEHLGSGDDVKLLGFGTFKTRLRATRARINPRTGRIVKARTKRVPDFSPGEKLRAVASSKDSDKTDDPGEFISKGKKK